MPSNVENILNGILTGDGSGIQKPASRVEELLFEIYEQGSGGGDSVIGGIKLTIDENYVMTATLVDKDGKEYGVSDDIDLPLEEMVVDAEYDPQTQKIKLELKNGNYVEFSVAELVSGLQTELSSSNKLNPAYIDYDASHRAVSDTEKDTWNAKQNAISDLETIRSGAVAGATAVQPSSMATALAGKQDTISDLEAIRSGAAAGATAVQPATMTEALAAKQNSLSDAQLAAVNSGIDSTKVEQISTNQTNILYTINTGVKNLFNPIDEFSGSSTISTINNGDGTYKITGGSNIATVQYASFFLKAGTYVLSGCPENGSDNTYRLELRTEPSTAGIIIDYGTGATAIIENSGYYLMAIRLAANYTAPSSGLLFKPMICEKSVWDSTNHDFQPPALPNYDLTRLQSEDRAALAEEIDAGAKNFYKYDIETIKSFNNTFTWNNNVGTSPDNHITITLKSDNTIQVVSDGSNAQVEFKIGSNTVTALTTGANYVLSGCPSGGSATKYDQRLVFVTSQQTYIQDYGSGESFTCPNARYTHVIVIRANQSLNAIFKPMLCTLADWKVSQKFVPYRKNLDQLEATKAPALDTGAGVDSGSLDDISKNTFALYATSVSNLPTNTSYYYVETIVYTTGSSGYAIQKAYSATDGTSYIRIRNTGTWSAWKQITNA